MDANSILLLMNAMTTRYIKGECVICRQRFKVRVVKFMRLDVGRGLVWPWGVLVLAELDISATLRCACHNAFGIDQPNHIGLLTIVLDGIAQIH